MQAGASPTFAVVALPQLPDSPEADERAIALAYKFREIRLQSLKVAPEAFASSYEVESQRGIDQTLQRLSNPKAIIFVAIRSPSTASRDGSGDGVHGLLNSDWVGFIGLLGPETEEAWSAVSAQRDPWARTAATTDAALGTTTTTAPVSAEHEGIASAVKTLHYHIGGVFVSPAARHHGLGKALIDAALARASAMARSTQASMRCSILVMPENAAALKLYEKAGFVVVGEETYVQQPRALVAGETQADETVALRMEFVESVTPA